MEKTYQDETTIQIKIERSEKNRLEKAAHREEMSLTNFIKKSCNDRIDIYHGDI